VPPFDPYKPCFFERIARSSTRCGAPWSTNWSTGAWAWPWYGKRIDRDFAAKAGEIMGFGLNIDEIYNWREEAWKTAKKNLGQ
jgi:hypothetical protein